MCKLWNYGKTSSAPPLPSSHLHNTFTKSERVGFVRGACLCTLPALWGAITRPVPLCSVEHNSGSWGFSRSFFFLFSARVLTEAFTCGVIDALQLAINRQSLFTWAGGPLSADSTQLLGEAVASAVPSPKAGFDCCVGTLGADAGSCPSWLCRTYCWHLSPNKPNQWYCVQNRPSSPATNCCAFVECHSSF